MYNDAAHDALCTGGLRNPVDFAVDIATFFHELITFKEKFSDELAEARNNMMRYASNLLSALTSVQAKKVLEYKR